MKRRPRSRLKKNLTAVPVEESALSYCVKAEERCEGNRRGLTLGTLILLLVTVGCIAAAALSYQKMSMTLAYAADVRDKLIAAEKRADELTGRIRDLQTLNELQNKAQEAPPLFFPR